MESSWTSLLTTHFNATKAHPVSSFDPSGFVIIASALLLLVGAVVGSVRWLFSSDGRLLRDQMEKNLQEMQDYVDEQRKQVEENLESFKEQAGRQGFIAEMLSFAYLSRLAFSIVAMVITSYLNALAAVVAGWRTPNVIILTLTKEDSGEKTLPDLGHDFFKYVATRIYGSFVIKYFHLPDQFLAAVAAMVVIMLFFHPRRLLILRRICSIFACINLMRAICVAATSLPDASPMCIAQFESDDGIYKAMPIFPKAFARAFKVLLRPSEHITCGDMVFSGHTVFFMLCAMTVKWYCVRSELDTSFTRRYPQVLWMVRYTVYSGVGFGIFMIIGTRLHYTLDVLIAIYVTTQVWFMYHWLLSNPRKSMRVLNWLEHDEVRFIDSDAYRQARRSFRLKKNVLLSGAKTDPRAQSANRPAAPTSSHDRITSGRLLLRANGMESWTDYFTSHFYAIKMRPVSAFDPSGFMIVISALLLLFGVILASARTLLASHGSLLRSRVTRNLQEMTDYVNDQRKQVGENLQSLKGQAIAHSGRQGFIAEMLSVAYLSRFAFSLTIFAIASYLNALAAVIAGWRTPNVVILNLNKQDTGVKTLPDLGHDLFKYVMTKIYGQTTYIEWFDLPDEFLAAVGTCVGILLILHPRRLLILRRFCAIFACINMMRAFCVAVTSLPDASPMCISQFDSERRGLYKSLPIFPKAFDRAWKVLVRPSQHITCGDMVFSGHTVFFMLCAMTVKTYCIKSELNTPFTRRYPYVLWMVRYYVYTGVAFGVFAIVGTRLHYTLDVLIAVYITAQVWATYHWLCAHPKSSFQVLNWLEHEEVHFIDLDAYRKARRSFTNTSETESFGDKDD